MKTPIDWLNEQNKDRDIIKVKILISKGIKEPDEWVKITNGYAWNTVKKNLKIINDILYYKILKTPTRMVVPKHFNYN